MDITSPMLFFVIIAVLVLSFFLGTIFLKEKKGYVFQSLILLLLSVLFLTCNIAYTGDGVTFSEGGDLLLTTIENDKNYVEKVQPVGKLKIELNKGNNMKKDKVFIRKNFIRGTKIYAPEKALQELNGFLKADKQKK